MPQRRPWPATARPTEPQARRSATTGVDSMRQRPPFRADHVGSFLRPQRLLEAREQHQRGQARRRRAARDRGRVHRRGRARRGAGRPARRDRRRVPAHLFPRRLSRAPGRGRGQGGGLYRLVPARRRLGGELSAADHAHHRQGAAHHLDPGRGFRFPESDREADAQGLHSLALDAALSRRPAGDQRDGLPRPRPVLQRPRRRLSRRGGRSRRARLPLPAARRHQPRLSVRRQDPRGDAGAWRRSRRPDAALLPG